MRNNDLNAHCNVTAAQSSLDFLSHFFSPQMKELFISIPHPSHQKPMSRVLQARVTFINQG